MEGTNKIERKKWEKVYTLKANFRKIGIGTINVKLDGGYNHV